MILPAVYEPDRYDEACRIAGGGVQLHAAMHFACHRFSDERFNRLLADFRDPERWRDAIRDLVTMWREDYQQATGDYPHDPIPQ